ncbi:MAG: cobaltochelatase subunit CobN, partial [Magnetovibrio sp.]|nr:cobaltochelatase subunit CobN [Magnetovibrio sp.]
MPSQKYPRGFLPGDDQPDPELSTLTTLREEDAHRMWQYLVLGGPDNAQNFMACAAHLVGFEIDYIEPCPVLPAGAYWPQSGAQGYAEVSKNWRSGQAVVPIIFYRALYLSGNLQVINDLVLAVQKAGLNPLPIFVASLKDPVSVAIVDGLLAQVQDPFAVVLNTTGFAISNPGGDRVQTPFDAYKLVLLQVVLSGGNFDDWQNKSWGLGPRDIAMNVALPEVDGRILSRAISFKGLQERDPDTQCDIVAYQPVQDRVTFVAELAKGWARLRTLPNASKKIVIVLANYPNRDGRIGNGVG